RGADAQPPGGGCADPRSSTSAYSLRLVPGVLGTGKAVTPHAPHGSRSTAHRGTLQFMPIRSELRAELLKLPADERQKLADELYESLDELRVDPEWESAWSEEIARRLEDIADGKVALVDADEMHDELHEELRNRGK
ncbi:MAG: addiction module protein, partial [Candidatus Binatia bacterium]